MPRRNSNAREPQQMAFHGATHYHSGYKEKCVGCFFVGQDFTCTTSDGECLKTHTESKPKTKPRGGKKNGKRFRNARTD
jgi:hypothetical protein